MAAGENSRKVNGVGPTGRRVAANVKALRQTSTYELSRELAKWGRPIQPTGITKLEAGERQVTVDDLMALAAALNVSPTRLMMPPEADDQPHPATETSEVPAAMLWSFTVGDRPLQPTDNTPENSEEKYVNFHYRSKPPQWRDAIPMERFATQYSELTKALDTAIKLSKKAGVSGRQLLMMLDVNITLTEMRRLTETNEETEGE